MRRFLPALYAALLLLLCACGQTAPGHPAASPSPIGSLPSSSAPPEQEPWTDRDVKALLEACHADLVEFQDIGATRLVRYTQEDDMTQTLALVDFQQHTLTPLTEGLMPEAKIGAMDNDAVLNGLYILHPGTNPHGPQQLWPTLEHLWLPQSAVEPVRSTQLCYLMPRERSFSIGHHQGGGVERVTLGNGRIYFEFLDNGGLLMGGGPLTPQMAVSFRDGICTVFFPGSVLDEAFQAVELQPERPSEPALLSAVDTAAGAQLEFACGSLFQNDTEESQIRWYIEESGHPVTELPRAAICFERCWTSNYPEGW